MTAPRTSSTRGERGLRGHRRAERPARGHRLQGAAAGAAARRRARPRTRAYPWLGDNALLKLSRAVRRAAGERYPVPGRRDVDRRRSTWPGSRPPTRARQPGPGRCRRPGWTSASRPRTPTSTAVRPSEIAAVPAAFCDRRRGRGRQRSTRRTTPTRTAARCALQRAARDAGVLRRPAAQARRGRRAVLLAARHRRRHLRHRRRRPARPRRVRRPDDRRALSPGVARVPRRAGGAGCQGPSRSRDQSGAIGLGSARDGERCRDARPTECRR